MPVVHVQVGLSGKVDPSGKSGGKNSAQVEIAVAENAVVSHVRAGENNGRKLDHVASRQA